jgi:hypothetical protein
MPDGYMIRFRFREKKDWRSIKHDGEVRYFATADEAHQFKERLEAEYGSIVTYNVDDYDTSALP